MTELHEDWERVNEMSRLVVDYFRSRKEDQAMPTDDRFSCLDYEGEVETCQWLEELRRLYVEIEPLPFGVTISPLLTDGLFFEDACFLNSTICQGTDVKQYIGALSPQECWQLCADERGPNGVRDYPCDCFTFRPTDGSCFLKKGIERFDPMPNRISGERKCNLPNPKSLVN